MDFSDFTTELWSSTKPIKQWESIIDFVHQRGVVCTWQMTSLFCSRFIHLKMWLGPNFSNLRHSRCRSRQEQRNSSLLSSLPDITITAWSCGSKIHQISSCVLSFWVKVSCSGLPFKYSCAVLCAEIRWNKVQRYPSLKFLHQVEEGLFFYFFIQRFSMKTCWYAPYGI